MSTKPTFWNQRNVALATLLVVIIGLIALNVVRSLPRPVESTSVKPSNNAALSIADPIAEGQRLFAANCTACHNASLNPLNAASVAATRSDAELHATIMSGKQTGALVMPGFAAQFSSAQVDALIAYLRSTW